MCGIVASLETPLEKPLEDILSRGIRHTHVNGIIHRRLPIRDLSRDYDQPIVYRGWTISFVGEFFNIGTTHELQYVAQNLIGQDGGIAPSVFHELQQDGFWAVVAQNPAKDELHLIADYLAQKPLYYREDIASCASEITPLKHYFPVTPDNIYLSATKKWGYSPETHRTPWNEIKRVLPGEYVILRPNRPPLKRIVDPLFQRALPANSLKQAIITATHLRAEESDVSVSLLLSTGLDSNIIGSILPNARRVSAPEYFEAPKSEYDFQEPINLGSLDTQNYLADQVDTTVVITGDGADELFGGYRRTLEYDSQGSDIFHELVGFHLSKLDRVHANRLQEVRTPFLARDVVQAALALPYDLRKNKRILRELWPEFKDLLKIPMKPNGFSPTDYARNYK